MNPINKKNSLYCVFTLIFSISLSHAAWVVKSVQSTDKGVTTEKIEFVDFVDRQVESVTVLKSMPEFIMEDAENFKSALYKEVLYPDNKLPTNIHPLKFNTGKALPGAELKTILKQGKDSNRIVITIIGDGYTQNERQKFFDDVQRMVNDMFVGETFKSYLSVFNIYAVFVPSRDSGITDRVRKDTIFGLYRSPIGSKRGIMPGNRRNIEKALKEAPSYTDYPIIIANDNYYGGLGGRYAITTRSLKSGSVVLRHELGHNFGNVGEEYDGGQVYSGANFSTNGQKWNHWKTNTNNTLHRNEFIMGAYVWAKLDKPFKKTFKFTKDGFKLGFKISSVGWDTKEDVDVLVDGRKVELIGDDYTDDRNFYRTKLVDLSPGQHEVEVRQNIADGNNILAYVNAYAYPASYPYNRGQEISAFSVFNNNRSFKGYRPTENSCLMRDMKVRHFCAVDQENIWIEFFKRVKLIDGVSIANESSTVTLNTLSIGAENLDIKWFQKFQRAETELTNLRGKSTWENKQRLKGQFRVKVKFISPEVKVTNPNFSATKDFTL
jgi:hypothetical protein